MHPLRLACADFTFPLLPHDQALDLIAMLDVQGLDLGLFEARSHLWPSKVFRSLAKSASTMSKKLGDRGLHLADVFLQTAPEFTSLAVNHPDATRRRKARDLYLRTLEFAGRCGAKHVTTLPGVPFQEEPTETSLGRASEELEWRVGQAKGQGLIFSVEAHVGSIVPTPKEALRLLAMTPGLTLTLDYTHFTKMGFPDAAIEPLVAHATHFHARGACKGRLQCSFKQNTIDYSRVLQAMETVGYKGHVGVEYVWIDWEHCNEVDTLSETILMRDFLRAAKPRKGGRI